jgi:hypothetical protein
LLILPHDVPTTGFAGQEVGAQHWLSWLSHTSPAGQPQLLLFPPHPLLTLPHAEPTAGVGQPVGLQQTAGFTDVLQSSPMGQLQLMLPPQPLLNEPQAAPPAVPGPPGTFAHVYATPFGVLHWHVPPLHTSPFGQPHMMVPPTPFDSIPHWPG